MQTHDLDGRVAVVIGSADGIGLASARALAARKAIVVLADIDGAAATSAASSIEQEGGKAMAYAVDASVVSELEALFAFISEQYGKLNILFSSVGSSGPDGIEVTEASFDRLISLNLKSHFFATQFALPLLRRSAPHASVILMSSTAALRANRRSPLYSISKAAVVMMARSLAKTLGHEGVRVNAVCPGHVATAFPQRWLGLDDDAYGTMMERSAADIPLGRVGRPEDVAETVAFLASDQSSYLTGLAIPIDGGSTA